MAKRIDLRRVKGNWAYRIDEAARVTGTHRNTVRNWIKAGLTVLEGRPVMILGTDLTAFHRARRDEARTATPPGTIYCLPCRRPQVPAGTMADFVIDEAGVGRLQGLCPTCDRMMSRFVSEARLPEIARGLAVQRPRGSSTL